MRIVWSILFALSVFIVWFFLSLQVHARDLDGQYKDTPLHAWFDSLASKNGLCCSFADGRMVDDPDINMDGNRYKVRIDGEWIEVPGRAVVWPYKSGDGKTVIRCFMPGAGI